MLKKSLRNKQLGRKYVQILGINIDSTLKEQVLMRVKNFLSHNTKIYIVTPNPELVLMSQENSELKKALNTADVSIPDGVGLKLGNYSLKIIKGRELFMDLIKLANDEGLKVFFLGGKKDEALKAGQKLNQTYKKIKIMSSSGPILDDQSNPVSKVDRKIEIDTINRINSFKPHFLFVAFGNPKQEIWIYRNLSKLNVKVAMAVGGVFRYVSGYSKVPPKLFHLLGIEWLWRLITEPFRLKRIWNAVIVFPWKLFLSRVVQEIA